MKTTVAQIQRCKPGLGLPGNAEETLTVFAVVNQLQTLLLDLEKVRRSDQPRPLKSVSNLSVSAESPGSVHPGAPETGPVQGCDSRAAGF